MIVVTAVITTMGYSDNVIGTSQFIKNYNILPFCTTNCHRIHNAIFHNPLEQYSCGFFVFLFIVACSY